MRQIQQIKANLFIKKQCFKEGGKVECCSLCIVLSEHATMKKNYLGVCLNHNPWAWPSDFQAVTTKKRLVQVPSEDTFRCKLYESQRSHRWGELIEDASIPPSKTHEVWQPNLAVSGSGTRQTSWKVVFWAIVARGHPPQGPNQMR